MFRKHPLEEQALDLAEQLRNKLTRMGFRDRVKGREFDEVFQVEWRQIEASPQFVRLRIDVDVLPQSAPTSKLKNEEVLNDLGHTLGYTVTFEDRDKKAGCWFVIHLSDHHGIPKHVRFKDFIGTYPANPAPMTIPVGMGLTGPVWRDLRGMPHLLVAGATGKGKSVLVHAVLSTLLHIPPTRLKVVLADLKGGMTLGKYKRIPHLARQHYVNRAEDLPLLLLAIQTEMQRRAEAMENVAEDIDEWNRTRVQKWPYILVVIEELANAMLAKKRVKLPGMGSQTIGTATEELLADIAARARATGIHLIATTQSPRADVISGIIKANFPVRIAFGTASDMDSRVIIDDSRAQGLAPGRMQFLDCADISELQAPELGEDDRATILKKTLAGEHWLVAQSAEQRLTADIHLLLTVAERDFRGTLDIELLYRAPDVKQARMTPDRIKECMAVLVADGAVSKVFLTRNYRLALEGAIWREKYPLRPLVLSDWDASIPASEQDIIEGEAVASNTSSIPPRRLLKEAEYQGTSKVVSTLVLGDGDAPIPDLATDIRRWDALGYSRNQMVERLGMDRNAALQMITFVLGPARRTQTQEAPCSVQS
jgi:hypothetical protein